MKHVNSAELLRTHFYEPTAADHKYTRGVVTMVTGSLAYPGAALIGTEAAARCGLGMVRYWGPGTVAAMVVARTPEVVPAPGRSQCFVLGSGWDLDDEGEPAGERLLLATELIGNTSQDAFVVLDASVLSVIDGISDGSLATILTPHAGEASEMLMRIAPNSTVRPLSSPAPSSPSGPTWTRAEVEAHPRQAAETLAEYTGATVVLKGHSTWIAAAGEESIECVSHTTRLATAGTGDALAGIIGAALALNHERVRREVEQGRRRSLMETCAAAITLHSLAAAHASGPKNSPILATDIARCIRLVLP